MFTRKKGFEPCLGLGTWEYSGCLRKRYRCSCTVLCRWGLVVGTSLSCRLVHPSLLTPCKCISAFSWKQAFITFVKQTLFLHASFFLAESSWKHQETVWSEWIGYESDVGHKKFAVNCFSGIEKNWDLLAGWLSTWKPLSHLNLHLVPTSLSPERQSREVSDACLTTGAAEHFTWQ